MYLMSAKAEFAAKIIYLVCTCRLIASAVSHVKKKDSALKKRPLDWISFEFIREVHPDLTLVNDLHYFKRQRSIIREQLIPEKWKDLVSAELPAIKYPLLIIEVPNGLQINLIHLMLLLQFKIIFQMFVEDWKVRK
jgi:hypothetical protein